MTASEQKQTPQKSLEQSDVRTRVVLRRDYDPRKRHFMPGAKYRPLQNTFFMGQLDIAREDTSCGHERRFEPLATDDQGQLMHLSHVTEKQVVAWPAAPDSPFRAAPRPWGATHDASLHRSALQGLPGAAS